MLIALTRAARKPDDPITAPEAYTEVAVDSPEHNAHRYFYASSNNGGGRTCCISPSNDSESS